MVKKIGIILTTVVLAAIVAGTASKTASAWEETELNRQIEQTNFIVDGGCSGTLISVTEKLVLTNYHCVKDRIEVEDREVTNDEGFVKKVRVKRYADVPVEQKRYLGYDLVGSASYLADIVGEDRRRDLAVIRLKGEIPHTVYSPLIAGDTKVLRGERVYAVGNPAGNYATVVEGVVSSVNRTFEFSWTDKAKLPMIQFSGGIYGGNSGGALYNVRGELIGVPAAGYSAATFIGLAVPTQEVVKPFLRSICLSSVFDKDGKTKDEECKKKEKKEKKGEE